MKKQKTSDIAVGEYKDTPIGRIPKEWDVKSTHETLYMKGRIGWRGLKKSEFTETGPYLITGVDFIDNRIDWDNCFHITMERYLESPEIQIRENDVLITKDGTIGKVAFIDHLPGPASLNSHLLVLRPASNNIFPKFLFYILQSEQFIAFIDSIKTGSTLTGLSQSNFGKYKFPLPPVPIQHKIAAILSTVDAAIAETDTIIAKTEQIKKGLMQELFTRGLGHTEFKDTEIGRIPVNWDIVRLGQVTHKLIVPMRDKPKKFEGDIPWCRIEDFNGKYLSESKSGQFVNETIINEMHLKVFPAGSVICSCSANLGICAIAGRDLVTNQTFIGIVPKQEELGNEFLYYLMGNYANRLNKLSTGTTISYLPSKEFESFLIIRPPLAEQCNIAAILSNIDRRLEKEFQYHTHLEILKKGLIQDLLTGRNRVKTNNEVIEHA